MNALVVVHGAWHQVPQASDDGDQHYPDKDDYLPVRSGELERPIQELQAICLRPSHPARPGSACLGASTHTTIVHSLLVSFGTCELIVDSCDLIVGVLRVTGSSTRNYQLSTRNYDLLVIL